MKLFITCIQGFEDLLVEELKELGFSEIIPSFCGVFCESDELGIYSINYRSRIAGRVLMPISKFKCFGKVGLYQEAKKIDWESYLPSGATFAIDANVDHKELRNSQFCCQVVKDAICDQLREKRGNRPSINVSSPDVQLNLFIQGTSAVLSLDTSGAALFKRGYRQESIEAPIQESLAASILRLANYSVQDNLIDPCCGSGTFLMEAAMIATNTPAGFFRKDWGFMRAPFFSKEQWLKIKEQADSERLPLLKNKIKGIEINKNHYRICHRHLKQAGFDNCIELELGDFKDSRDSLANILVVNPPFGRRLSDEETLISLYRNLGDFMKQKMPKPSKGFVYTASKSLAKQVGLRANQKLALKSSGLEASLLTFDIY